MFEQKHEPLLSRAAFAMRLGRSFGVTMLIVALSLLMGSTGYHYSAPMPWIDALLNAAMILTGMGPVTPVETTGGKLFATFYALYSGIAFLTMMAIILAPLQHRLLHKFHVEAEQSDDAT
jgi:hypothetical protein